MCSIKIPAVLCSHVTGNRQATQSWPMTYKKGHVFQRRQIQEDLFHFTKKHNLERRDVFVLCTFVPGNTPWMSKQPSHDAENRSARLKMTGADKQEAVEVWRTP